MKIKNILITFAVLWYLGAANAHVITLADQENPVSSRPTEMSHKQLRDFFVLHALQVGHLTHRSQQQAIELKQNTFQQAFLEYLKGIYNLHGYAEILGQDPTDIVQFLEMSHDLNLDISTIYVCMRLFYNKLKACEVVDDTMISKLLDCLPRYLEPYLTGKPQFENLEFLKKSVENTILSRFINNMDQFNTYPDQFIATLSYELAEFAQNNGQLKQDETRERLRLTTLKFLELALSKLMWDISEPSSSWISFSKLSEQLQGLGAARIISHMDDLDDLWWSLVHRYGYFIDVAGSMLPPTFFGAIEQDLATGRIGFLEIKEQDEGIRTKKDTLATALMKAKAKAIAFARQGIIANSVL